MGGEAEVVLHLGEVLRHDVGQRVLLAVDDALLEREVQLLEGDLGRRGAQGLGVHQELRGVGEAHPQPLQVRRLADRLVGREVPGACRPRPEDLHAGLRGEALPQVRRRVPGEELGQVRRRRRRRRRRRPRRSARRRRRAPRRPGCRCRGRRRRRRRSGRRRRRAGWTRRLDGQADVGRGHLVGDDLGAAAVLRLLVGVAVGERRARPPRGQPPPPPLPPSSSPPPQAAQDEGQQHGGGERDARRRERIFMGSSVGSAFGWEVAAGQARARPVPAETGRSRPACVPAGGPGRCGRAGHSPSTCGSQVTASGKTMISPTITSSGIMNGREP